MTTLRIALLWLITTAAFAEDGAAVRQKLLDFQRSADPHALDFAWPFLASPEAALREAARITIQSQPFESWQARALEEKDTWASLEILRALVESCPPQKAAALSPHLCEQITTLRLEHMDGDQVRATIRLTRRVFLRLGPVAEDERQQMRDLWSHFSLPPESAASEERRGLLRFLDSVRTRRP